MAKFCVNCGNELGENDNACSNCGTFINTEAKVVLDKKEEKTNGFAIAGFILSLISILCCGSTSVLGLVFSIIGVVKAKNYNNNGKGLAIAGIVIGCIGLLLLILLNLIGFSYNGFKGNYY